MKRLFILLAAAALFGALAGCQKEPAGKEGAESEVYVEFTINFANGAATKAEDHNSSTVAIGTEAEHAVKYAYLYFFNSDNKYVQTVVVASGDVTTSTSMGDIIKKTTIPILLTPGEYDVYATINHQVDGLTAASTQTEFEAKTYNHAYATFNVNDDGIPMSSRDTDGNRYQSVTVASHNTFDNPVKISLYMERMVAKLTINKPTAKFDVAANRDGSGGKVADVEINNVAAVNLTTGGYLFRHVGPGDGSTTFGVITSDNYVIEPETAAKINNGAITGLSYYDHVNSTSPLTWKSLATVGYSTYCLENTMVAEQQYKTYATALLYSGIITPHEGRFYPIGHTTATNWINGTHSNDLWYFDGYFYENLATLNAVKGLSLTETTGADNYYGRFGVKCFKNKTCYYPYYVRHFDNSNPEVMGKMEFAIVRNNDYQVTVSGLKSLGMDTIGVPTEIIEATETYFQATLLVRPWVVRAQDAILG